MGSKMGSKKDWVDSERLFRSLVSFDLLFRSLVSIVSIDRKAKQSSRTLLSMKAVFFGLRSCSDAGHLGDPEGLEGLFVSVALS
jgi:hypothetical protein